MKSKYQLSLRQQKYSTLILVVFIFCLPVSILSVLMSSSQVFAYGEAHIYISKEAFYVWPNDTSHEIFKHLGLNIYWGDEPDPEDTGTTVVEGAIEEDKGERGMWLTSPLTNWMDHSWNPDTDGVWTLTEIPLLPLTAIRKGAYLFLEARDQYKKGNTDLAYWYLGRSVHCLQDMAVPAHTHRDLHTGILLDLRDAYEYWTDMCGKSLNYIGPGATWDRYYVINNLGGLLNLDSSDLLEPPGYTLPYAVEKLFYNLAQATQNFPSNDVDADLNNRPPFASVWPVFDRDDLTVTGEFNTCFDEDCALWNRYLSPGQCIPCDINENTMEAMGETLIPRAIQFTATLYKLFWDMTHPTVEPSLYDNARFVADITIPDGTPILPSQSFTKTWRIRNSGTTTWGSDYEWVFGGGNQMQGQGSVSVTGVNPGNIRDVSVNLIAPTAPGTYTGYWRMRNSSGQPFGDTCWVTIKVAESATSWEFNTFNNFEGWSVAGVSASAVDHWPTGSDPIYLIINPATDPSISSPGLSLDSSRYNAVEFKMNSHANDNQGQIFFKTSGGYTEANSVHFAVRNDGLWHTYLIKLGDQSGWSGTITGIRFDPAANGNAGGGYDDIAFDSIKLVNFTGLVEGTLVRTVGTNAVYQFKGGRKWWIVSDTIFNTLGFNWSDIIDLSSGILSQYSDGPNIVSNGSLIRQVGANEVYLIENGQRRWITTPEAFNQKGFEWEDIYDVPSARWAALIALFPPGPDITWDTVPPSVSVGIPSGGENWVAGSQHIITWTATDDVGIAHIDLYYTTDGWASSQSIASNLANTSQYTWTVPGVTTGSAGIRVVADDTSGNSGDAYSGFFIIVSDCPTPPAPTLYDPSVSGYNYTLSWSAVAEADSYILQEDTDPAFTNPTEISLTQTAKYIPNQAEGSYHYRVCGVNTCGRGIWSNTESVSISGRQWPGAITDRSPSNGATNQPLNVTLSWNCTHPTGESLVYDVWFSVGDESFIPSEVVSAGQTGKTYTVNDLPYNTTCYWKIEARDETGDRRTSDVYQFTTIGDATPPTGSVLINNGAATTETLSVTLYLSATDSESGVKYMRASNDGSTWSYWKYYAATWPAWSLADALYGGTYVPQGTYAVYVQFKDEQGNISATYTDTIQKVSGTAGDILLNGKSYQTIQDAIDAAEYGETVYLTEGTYTYQGSQKPPRYPYKEVGIVMKAGVNLIGAGADKTKLVLEYGSDALIDADDCLVQGMTIINADPYPATRQSVKIESANSKLRYCKITTSGSDNYGVWIYNGVNNEISNNLIISNKYGIYVWGTNVKIYNNTVVDNGLTGILNNSSTSIIKNNIVTGNYRGVRVSNAVFTYNNVWGNTYANYDGDDQTGINGNISANPVFVNPASGNYSLSSGSPCRNTGTNVGIPYNESAPDMGAFEYGGSGTVTVVTNRTDAAFEIIGPSVTYQGSGTSWSMSGLPLGIYSITFTPIANLYTPEYEAKMLQSNQTLTFNGTYANDTIPPQAEPENFLAPVAVNYGEYATADTLVDIVLAFVDEVAGLGSGAQMMFSNDGVSWSPPEAYSTLKKDWNLTQFGGNSTQGMKTVYVKVSDAFGNWTAPLTDTILYVPNRQVLEVPEAYSAIQDALNVASPGDVVHVLPGTYNPGAITVPQGVRFQGSGPALTTLIASQISMSSDSMIEGFTLNTWSSARCENSVSGVIIANNVFTEGGYGVEIFSGSQVIVRNNIFDGLNYGGIYVESPQADVSAIIENNTLVNSGGFSAIDLSNASPDTRVYVYNNILANNPGYAIRDGNTQDTEHKHIFSQFNTFWNNAQGDFGGTNSDKITGAGDLHSNPMFVDAANGNYRLLPGSPCINNGYPEDRYNDRDGTRNDRGAYGGPCLNTPPHAEFLIDPTLIGIQTPFSLDASFSSDSETETNKLLVRWDFDNDGTYDTNFTTTKTDTHQYGSLGAHTIGLQIKDGNGSVASMTSQITVANSSPNMPGNPIPSDGSLDQGINVTLSWQGGDPDSGDTVTYDVYFGTSSNPPLISSGQTATTYNPGTLNYLTFYYWKVVATDNHGASSISPVWSFVTQVEPVPQVPTNLSANPVSSSQINLTWTDNSTNEIGFKIERKIGAGGSWSQIYVVGAGISSYSDTGLNSDTTYYYRIRSYNASGNSAYSNETNAHTPAAPEINVKQGGTDIPSGGSYNFGAVNVGTSSSAITFMIQNLGSANLTLSGIQKTGSHPNDFTVTQPLSSTVAPGGSTTFTITFLPTATGTRTATIEIANNDSNENPYTFTGTGTGQPGNSYLLWTK